MKNTIKKYIYLINDVTNLLLNKEQVQAVEQAHKLRVALIAVCVILAVSIIINICLILIRFPLR